MMNNEIKMAALNDNELECVVGGEESKKIGIPIDDYIRPVTDEEEKKPWDGFVEILTSPLYVLDTFLDIFRK